MSIHATHSAGVTLRTDYLTQASAATQQAREACATGYKLQRPKAANVAYLWRHGFVDINLVKSRVPLKAGDFLTEYAVRDKSKIRAGIKGKDNVLWYAHFHFSSAKPLFNRFDKAHLKTPDQRDLGLKWQQKQASSGAAVDPIWRGPIGKPFAELYFEPLFQT